MLRNRRNYLAFSRGSLSFLDVGEPAVLAYLRSFGSQEVVVLANMSAEEKTVSLLEPLKLCPDFDMLERPVTCRENSVVLAPYGFHWLAAVS